ncbi:MAG: hypothetical protein ABGY71_14725 [bacterium]|nr:hypothetical protein [Planctomycetota bacterium]HIL51483.1 hypothetical protein [Planctomycetota bacterium]
MTVSCESCRHFRRKPYEAPHTGCYHLDLMVVKQKESILDEQQTPGDHRKLNLLGDCEHFSARPEKPSLLKRLLGG